MKHILLAPLSKRTALEYLYAALSAILGFFGFMFAFAVLTFGSLLTLTLVGLPLIAVGLYGARLLGEVQRWFAQYLLGIEIEAPPPICRPPGAMAKLAAALKDAAGWRALAYQLIRTPIALAYSGLLFFAVFVGLFALTYPLWWAVFDPTTVDQQGLRHHSAIQINDFYVDSWPRALVTTLFGAAFLWVIPWLLRVTVFLDEVLMRGLLCPTRSEQRILDLTESRAHAVDDSAAALRRIERDLHDGAQAQLVALAMQLGEAKENLEAPPGSVDLAETRALIDTAHRSAKLAINELRDLARGIHPPALDNGLEDALGTLAARTALPVNVRIALRDRPSPAVETIAYYCAAELLTNAAKHSRTQLADIVAEQEGSTRRLRVTDYGRGGLAGLVDRVGTVDGALRLDSPLGGPTVVTIELPMQS